MANWGYEISLLVLKKYFSTLEQKFRISARPCTNVSSIHSLLLLGFLAGTELTLLNLRIF